MIVRNTRTGVETSVSDEHGAYLLTKEHYEPVSAPVPEAPVVTKTEPPKVEPKKVEAEEVEPPKVHKPRKRKPRVAK